MTTALRMTYDDLIARPDDGYRYELVRGEILRLPLPKGDHGYVEAGIVVALARYLHERAIALGWDPETGQRSRSRVAGYLASGEAGIRFSLPDDPDQVRGADVLYLSPEQFRRLDPLIRTEYIPELPALVVEVISPSERATDSNQKVTDYLAGGALLIWQIYPETRTARVYTADGRTWTVPTDGALEGGEVLPGFSLRLATLFE